VTIVRTLLLAWRTGVDTASWVATVCLAASVGAALGSVWVGSIAFFVAAPAWMRTKARETTDRRGGAA